MDVVSVSPLRAASFVWQPKRGAWACTVVCKATFDLPPGEAQLAAELHVVRQRRHARGALLVRAPRGDDIVQRRRRGSPITERIPPQRLGELTMRTRPTDPLPPSGPAGIAPLRDDPTWQPPVIALRKLRNEFERLYRASPDGDTPEHQVRVAAYLVLDHLFYALDEFANRAIRREPYRLLATDDGRTSDGASINLVIVRDERL